MHVFWDVFCMLADGRHAIYLDAGSYAIAQWGAQGAAARGAPVYRFPHGNDRALQRLLRRRPAGRVPVVVADGMCSACGCALPVASYLDCVRKVGGRLVIDDTQALGILGRHPDVAAPYGHGGGGSMSYSGVGGPDVTVISSLAKGFGVPVAVLSGSNELVREFEARSQTRVHCSPPSAAAIHAAGHALRLNALQGEALRQRLLRRVRQFRRSVAQLGFESAGGLFPVQTLRLSPGRDARSLHRRLSALGVRTVLHQRSDGDAQISFIITARHRSDDVDGAVEALACAMQLKCTPSPSAGADATRRWDTAPRTTGGLSHDTSNRHDVRNISGDRPV